MGKYDVIIVGAGIAGLYTAIHSDARLRVLVLAKGELNDCNSALAQGGIAIAFDPDDIELHIEDSLKAGGYTNNREALRVMVEGSLREYRTLCEMGVKFDRERGMEGGHSVRRIVCCKDSTGAAVMDVLTARVRALPNVELLEDSRVVRIEKQGKMFRLEVSKNDDTYYYNTTACVIATGGIGGLYEFSTNSRILTGDGIRFAEALGAKIENMHLVQFHPTGFAGGFTEGRAFLISEAVRGEGARLLNADFERFTDELQPRDAVTQAILAEEKRLNSTNSNKFYLDISHKDADFVKARFPMIYERLLAFGCDLTREPVPIYPCQHYLMGGIAADTHGRTTVPALYAVGECSHTGVHGNNRLASNSLLEALVFGRLTALQLALD
jgi:L-aspartate oxidase